MRNQPIGEFSILRTTKGVPDANMLTNRYGKQTVPLTAFTLPDDGEYSGLVAHIRVSPPSQITVPTL